MRVLVYLLLFVVSSASASTEECTEGDVWNPSTQAWESFAERSHTKFSEIVPKESKESPDAELANGICDAMILYSETGTGTVWEAFEKMVLEHLDLEKTDPTARRQITEYWNEYSYLMVCTEERVGFIDEHILKRIVDLKAVKPFYFDYFLKDRSRDLNAVECRDGKPETLVDYLDGILASPDSTRLYNTTRLDQLRGFITHMMGAKTAAEVLTESAAR